MHDITVRQMDFGIPESIDPLVMPGEPEWSYFTVALSLLLPYLEPYLIHTMKRAKAHIRDPDLLADLAQFTGQEGQHYRQHILFNDAVRGYGFTRLNGFESELKSDYERFTRTKSLRWNLAYAEGFEALTTAVARYSFEMGFNAALEPRAVRNLWSWHLVEEVEHRTVAFDVYDGLYGSYGYRLLIASYGQWHLLQWVFRVLSYMLKNDTRVHREFGGPKAQRRRILRHVGMMRRHLLPKVLRTYSPRYRPQEIEVPNEMKRLAEEYTQSALRTS